MNFIQALKEGFKTKKLFSKDSTSKKKGGNMNKQAGEVKKVKKRSKSFLNGADYA
jgi:hypothetical protein